MDKRMQFIAAVLADELSMSEVCEEFGVSRKTGYKFLRRYQAQGPAGLVDRSRAPQRVPWALSQAQAEAILGLRRAHRSWGPKKLRTILQRHAPAQQWPAHSTIGELLRRHGLTARRQRRPRATPSARLAAPVGANDIWGVDFKGWFRTADGARCDPLTATDGFSRYLLCATIVTPPDYQGCRSQFERIFKEYGLPRVIRSDNGAPFASVGAGGLSRLSAWWIKLGITPQRIAPGRPQQNGRHERMHKTLKAETASPPATNLHQQQQRFDRFRQEFNHERPHEALGQTPPAGHYASSPRRYPAKLEDPHYPADFELRRYVTAARSNGKANRSSLPRL